MNYRLSNAQLFCSRCDCQNQADAPHCRGCGISFIFGVPDAWETPIFTSGSTCLGPVQQEIWDNAKIEAKKTVDGLVASGAIDVEQMEKYFKDLSHA